MPGARQFPEVFASTILLMLLIDITSKIIFPVLHDGASTPHLGLSPRAEVAFSGFGGTA
jgi:hypothetical protein